MIVFIDESGDAGFKTRQGSSRSFIIALIIFDNEFDAEVTDKIIDDFKKKRNPSLRSEIKFNKLDKQERLDFLTAVKYCKFRVRAIVVQKDLVKSLHLKKETTFYYQYFLKQLLEHNRKFLKDAKLRLDSIGERKFKKAFQVYLRQYLNINSQRKVMRNIQFVDSKDNSLIQLADMIAGSIRRSYQDEKNDSTIYKQIIKRRIEEEWIFGESST